MMNEAMTPRQQRGLQIAATAKITRKDRIFTVPSQSQHGTYKVVYVAGAFLCTCPDFELTGTMCKHCYAVEFVIKRETRPDGTVEETRSMRVSYPQNWPAYNAAQTNEKETFCQLLRDLVADIPSPEQKRGRPALPLNDMLFSAAFKVYSTVSGRRFMTDLRDAQAKGLITKTPHYNSIFNVLENPAVTPIIKALITRSAVPLKALETNFAVDSTGFGTQQFYRHFSAKYGKDIDKRDFVKVHAMIGCKTNVVTACEATERYTGDAVYLPELTRTTMEHFDVQQVAADKAYCSRKNLELLDGDGIRAMIPFRSNANPDGSRHGRSSAVWSKLYHFFELHRDQFLASYHTRSNVESTFSAMKRKFGDTVRSKTPTAQINETLLKVLCYNVTCVIHEMHESGVGAAFSLSTLK
jgi:transposase